MYLSFTYRTFEVIAITFWRLLSHKPWQQLLPSFTDDDDDDPYVTCLFRLKKLRTMSTSHYFRHTIDVVYECSMNSINQIFYANETRPNENGTGKASRLPQYHTARQQRFALVHVACVKKWTFFCVYFHFNFNCHSQPSNHPTRIEQPNSEIVLCNWILSVVNRLATILRWIYANKIYVVKIMLLKCKRISVCGAAGTRIDFYKQFDWRDE